MIEIRNNPAIHCYEAFLDTQSAGFCEYTLDATTTPAIITFTHTVVDPQFEGRGVGAALAKHVLNDSRAHGWKVVPTCKFIAGYMQRHSDDQDLLFRKQIPAPE